MISIEVLLLVVIGISSAVLYSMYRYFNDMIDSVYQEVCEKKSNDSVSLKNIKECYDKLDRQNTLLMQMNRKFDNAIEDMEKSINHRLNTLEKINFGSIRVVTPPLKERSKNAQQRPTSTKTKSS